MESEKINNEPIKDQILNEPKPANGIFIEIDPNGFQLKGLASQLQDANGQAIKLSPQQIIAILAMTIKLIAIGDPTK